MFKIWKKTPRYETDFISHHGYISIILEVSRLLIQNKKYIERADSISTNIEGLILLLKKEMESYIIFLIENKPLYHNPFRKIIPILLKNIPKENRLAIISKYSNEFLPYYHIWFGYEKLLIKNINPKIILVILLIFKKKLPKSLIFRITLLST